MVTKPELDKFIKSFNDKRIPKDYVLLNGQIVEAVLAYSEIYSKAKKTIYIVDNYIGIKTLHLLKASKSKVNVIILTSLFVNVKAKIKLIVYVLNGFKNYIRRKY